MLSLMMSAQSSNLTYNSLVIDSCYMKIDSQVIASHTFSISPPLLYDIEGSILRFPCDSLHYIGTEINISYRPLHLNLETPKAFIDRGQLKEKEKAVYIGYDYSP